MLDLYYHLSEFDIFNGIWTLRTSNNLIKAMLAFNSFGYFSRSQDAASEMLRSYGIVPPITIKEETPESGSTIKEEARPEEIKVEETVTLDASEVALVENEWTRASKQLGQWDVQQSLSQATGNISTLVEADFRLGDWKQLREHLQLYPLTDSGQHKLYACYVSTFEYYAANFKQRLNGGAAISFSV